MHFLRFAVDSLLKSLWLKISSSMLLNQTRTFSCFSSKIRRSSFHLQRSVSNT